MLQIQGACRRDEIPAAHPPWAASTFDVEKTWRTDPTASLSCALTSSNGFKLIFCQNITAIRVRLRNWLDAARGYFTCVIRQSQGVCTVLSQHTPICARLRLQIARAGLSSTGRADPQKGARSPPGWLHYHHHRKRNARAEGVWAEHPPSPSWQGRHHWRCLTVVP